MSDRPVRHLIAVGHAAWLVTVAAVMGLAVGVAWPGPALLARVQAQAPAEAEARPVFDTVVLRVRPTPAGPQYIRASTQGRVEIRGMSLADLVRFAYGSETYQFPMQVVGGPAWLHSQRFDADAVARAGVMPTTASSGFPPVLMEMLRAMLDDRFKLQARADTLEQDHYVLVRTSPDALGPQLRQRADCRPERPDVAADADTCNRLISTPGILTARAITLDRLALLLGNSPVIQKVVRNETGLEGIFDMDMSWVPDLINVPGGPPVPNPNAGSGPNMKTAMEQQLGLRLDPARTPVDVVVIEHAELP